MPDLANALIAIAETGYGLGGMAELVQDDRFELGIGVPTIFVQVEQMVKVLDETHFQGLSDGLPDRLADIANLTQLLSFAADNLFKFALSRWLFSFR